MVLHHPFEGWFNAHLAIGSLKPLWVTSSNYSSRRVLKIPFRMLPVQSTWLPLRRLSPQFVSDSSTSVEFIIFPSSDLMCKISRRLWNVTVFYLDESKFYCFKLNWSSCIPPGKNVVWVCSRKVCSTEDNSETQERGCKSWKLHFDNQ